MQHEENKFELFLQSKSFTIPSNFRYINDIDLNIYNTLLETNKYIVKSDVSEEVLQSFIKNWVYQELPIINQKNFSEYKKLSKEFDRMKDIIQLYKDLSSTSKVPSLIDTNRNNKDQIKQISGNLEKRMTEYYNIIDILFNDNKIFPPSHLQKVKSKLYYSCINNHLEHVELLLTQKVVENEDGLLFILNKQEMTCALFDSKSTNSDIFIPRSIFYKEKEFLVTRILSFTFKNSTSIKKVDFAEDSQITAIEQNTFAYSSIVKIRIPSSVTKIGEKSFYYCNNLSKVKFKSKSKLQFISDEAFYKTSLMNITIPNSVIEIGEGAFSDCIYLRDVKFDLPSQIKKIGKYSFNNTIIQDIVMPPTVTCIEEYTFSKCNNLQKVEFSLFSELKSIEKNAFNDSSIRTIVIPASVTELKEGWSIGLPYLSNIIFRRGNANYTYYDNKYILGKSNLNNFFHDVLLFARRDIEDATIPSFIIMIAPYAFAECKNLQKIDFEDNSELISIGEYAFLNSSITSIKIPSTVIEMKNCFGNTESLNEISVMPNNSRFSCFDSSFLLEKSDENAENYDVLVLARKNIEEAIIPSFVRKIKSYAFYKCEKLKIVKFIDDSQLVSIGKNSFSFSALRSIKIPKNVRKINKYCFYQCIWLKNVEFDKNCELKQIKKNTFNGTVIEYMKIPSKVTKIGKLSFASCNHLKCIEFDENSELNMIQNDAFYHSSIELLQIPSKVTKIKEGWCDDVDNLKNIFVDKNNENFIFYEDNFLLGKSNMLCDEFDVLLFARRNIIIAKIPSFIKRIASYAFCSCNSLVSAEFFEDSQLCSIDDYAFYNCSIFSISIPSHVNNLYKCTFERCYCLQIIEIVDDSELISFNTSSLAILMVSSTIKLPMFFYSL